MQEKLFNIRQVLLFVGDCGMGDDQSVQRIIRDLGFTQAVMINGQSAMATKALYSGYFEEKRDGDVLWDVKESIYEICRTEGVGVLDFFLVDVTEANMFKSIWHDGYY